MLARFDDLSAAALWFDDWLNNAALPMWAQAGVDPKGGLFHETLSLAGRPVNAERRARAQARQVFVFASAKTAGYGDRWLDVANAGWSRFVEAYRRPDGLFMNRVSGDGTPVDEEANVYEQAFAMLAMSALHSADPSVPGWAHEAEQVLDAIQPLRTKRGGFREHGAHAYQANCNMHLFETALAWELAGGRTWEALSDELAALAMTRFIDPENGAMREFFDEDWTALRGEEGLQEPGHHFEWAWLLERWGARRGEAAARKAARRLFENGLRGVDPVRCVAVNSVWEDFSMRDASARLWPQTEHLKAALLLGDEPLALRAANGLAQYLEVPASGVWRDKLRADGTFMDEPAPATSFYHLMVAILELTAHLRTST